MNKKKILISLAAVFIILFLLLPVFKGGSKKVAKEKAVPQIASSNPLTKAVQFLASIIGLNNSAARDAVTAEQYVNSTPRKQAAPGVNENGGDIPRATTGGGNYNDDNVRLPEDLAQNYGMAEVKDNEGNWVLIKQSMPAVSTRGMYDADIKEDPASVIEGRRISDAIARDNTPVSAGINMFTPFVPLSPAAAGAAQRGVEFAANSFRAPGGLYYTSGGGYYASGSRGGGNSGGFGSADRQANNTDNVNDLESIFTAAQAKAASAGARINGGNSRSSTGSGGINQSPGGNNKPGSNPGPGLGNQPGQNRPGPGGGIPGGTATAPNFSDVMAKAEAATAARLKQEGEGAGINYYNDSGSCGIIHEEEKLNLNCYSAADPAVIEAQRQKSVATFIKSMFPNNNLPPEKLQSLTEEYNSHPENFPLRPQYVYVLFQGTGDKAKDEQQTNNMFNIPVMDSGQETKTDGGCPDGQQCYYILRSDNSVTQDLSKGSGGSAFDTNKFSEIKSDSPSAVFQTVTAEDFNNVIKGVMVNQNKSEQKGGYVYVVVQNPGNALKKYEDTGSSFPIVYVTDLTNAAPGAMQRTTEESIGQVGVNVGTFYQIYNEMRSQNVRGALEGINQNNKG
ncbi:MAG: hypothetical protein FWF35_05655 [Elusimicrobia bacterium]|nr:hypothetical protein [Elusimicrobiota bacterium]